MLKIEKLGRLTERIPLEAKARFINYKLNKAPPSSPSFECKREGKDPDDYDDDEDEIHPALRTHTPGKAKFWKNIFFFICLPCIVLQTINVLFINNKPPKRPEFKPYPYLRNRTVPFPWDPVRTLFHNPRRNALPDGYELPEED